MLLFQSFQFSFINIKTSYPSQMFVVYILTQSPADCTLSLIWKLFVIAENVNVSQIYYSSIYLFLLVGKASDWECLRSCCGFHDCRNDGLICAVQYFCTIVPQSVTATCLIHLLIICSLAFFLPQQINFWWTECLNNPALKVMNVVYDTSYWASLVLQ